MQKIPVSINFAQGLDTKTDPFQVQLGQFEILQNSIFQTGRLLQKRPGYGFQSALNSTNQYLTTLNDNLISIGSTVSAYSSSLDEWITKGTLQPCSLSVLPIVRNNLNQLQVDSVVANGMVLTVYTQSTGGSTLYKYVIADAAKGQNICAPTLIPALTSGTITGSSRVYVVGNYFVIASPVTVSSVVSLQYFSIPTNNPVNVATNVPNASTVQKITSEVYAPISTNPGWDAMSVNSSSNNFLVVAYNTTTSGQGVHVAVLTSAQVAAQSSTTNIRSFTGAAYIGALVSVCGDLSVSSNVFYISFWNNATSTGYTAAVNVGLGSIPLVFAPVSMFTSTVITNLASGAEAAFCNLYYEVSNNYGYDSGIPSHYVGCVSVTQAGVVGTPFISVRSLGLASKVFVIGSTMYYLGAFQSPYQPSYFLINGSTSTQANPVIVSKLAYQNGGGYLTLGLPNVSVNGLVAQIPYLYKDDVEALNTVNTPQATSTGGIYTQLGANLISFTIASSTINTAEIASSLHISGGFLGQFDGYLPVEHNFFLFPDSVELSATTGGSMTAQTYFYQVIYEWTDDNGLPFYSAPSIAVSITTGSTGSVNVFVPYLRLTAKISSPVKIVIFRLSTAQESYFQVTSITTPTLNSTTSDYVQYTDTLADSSIVGNNPIYTIGGVVPDCNGPACNGIMGLFNSSLVMMDAENPNNAWISKTVVPGTPVEMSQDFTIYVSPTQGAQKSLGPVTAVAPMDDKFIFFFSQGASYINGQPPNILGTTAVGCSLGNYSQPIAIASSVGCTNQNSIVMTSVGLMFQSDKGIWMLNRFNLQTTYVGAPVEAFNSYTVTSSVVVPKTTYVLFTLNNGQILMYDYYYDKWGTFVGVTSTSSCIYNGVHAILDDYGNVLQQTPGAYLDNANPVCMSIRTSWINLAGVQGYQRFYWFYLLGQYYSPHFIECAIAYNYNSSLVTSAQVSPANFSSSIASPFGDQPAPFGSPVQLENWLIHAQYQKCQSFQITLQEVFNPAFGTAAGPGFTLSGINVIAAVKRGSRPIAPNMTTG